MSPRPPPKISLRHDHDWTRGNDELGSTVEQQPVGELVQQSCGEVQHATFFQLTQPKPKPICDRSGKPDSTEDVFVVKGETHACFQIRVVRSSAAAQFAESHNGTLWQFLLNILQIDLNQCDEVVRDVATLPLSVNRISPDTAIHEQMAT